MKLFGRFTAFSNVLLLLVMLITCAFSVQAELLFSDNFETTSTNWINVTVGDNKNWTRDAYGTSSYYTGPSSGANGSVYYMYLETSSGSAYTAGDSAILLGPGITHMNVQLIFQYHMYGADTGTLAVDVLSGGNWINGVWSVTGQQQSSDSAAYKTATVDLSGYSVSQIRFRATAAGGYRGDIAIDNISVSGDPAGPTAPVFNDDPIIKTNARQDQPYTDSLANDASDLNGDTLYFSKISGPDWLYVASDGALSGTPDDSAVGLNTFVVEVSDGSLSNSTTLNVMVNDNTTPIILSSDDFEQDMGGWINVTTGDNNDWARDSDGTPSSNTGPASGANGSDYYVYLETSSGSAYSAGDTAILQSPDISSGSNIQLKFQYHMYGSNTGTLAVDVLENGSWITDVWSVSGQQQLGSGEAYKEQIVDLSSYEVTNVRFRATAVGGYMGDIAIDNVELSIPAIITQPVAPVFLSNPISKPSAVINMSYSGSIAGDATDANEDSLTFSKESGPTWLNVNPDGSITGIPSSDDLGANSFVVSVSDGVFSTTTTLNISVLDSAFSNSVYPATAGHGIDGGANHGWTVDGVIDEFSLRTAYQDDVIVRRYTSLDFTKRLHSWGVFEFKLPQIIIDNPTHVFVESATLELDVDGSSSGTINLHGYLGNGSVGLSDFNHENLIASAVSTAQTVSADVTSYVGSVVGQSEFVGFLLKPWDINSDMGVSLWNGTPHPAFGYTSGQIARLVITYRIQ